MVLGVLVIFYSSFLIVLFCRIFFVFYVLEVVLFEVLERLFWMFCVGWGVYGYLG